MGCGKDLARGLILAACAGGLAAGCVTKEPPSPATRPVTLTTGVVLPEEMTELPTTQPVLREPKVIIGKEKSTLLYPCRQARPETLADAVTGLLSPQGTASASAALNTVIVSDAPETIDSVRDALMEMDHSVGQLLVESRVVEVKLESDL